MEIGLPASLEGTSRALSINALLIVVGLFSTTVVAAFGIGTRVFSVIFLPAIAVARGVETMSGQNIGAGKYDRAEQANYLAAKGLFVVLGLMGMAIFLVPQPIVAVFSDDPVVVAEGATFLRYVSLSFGFIGIMRAFTGGFRGAGKTLIAAAISVVTLAGIRLPIAYIASQYRLPIPFGDALFGVRGIWIAFFVPNIAGATIAWLWFRRGTWHEGDVRGPAGTGDAASEGEFEGPSIDD